MVRVVSVRVGPAAVAVAVAVSADRLSTEGNNLLHWIDRSNTTKSNGYRPAYVSGEILGLTSRLLRSLWRI